MFFHSFLGELKSVADVNFYRHGELLYRFVQNINFDNWL